MCKLLSRQQLTSGISVCAAMRYQSVCRILTPYTSTQHVGVLGKFQNTCLQICTACCDAFAKSLLSSLQGALVVAEVFSVSAHPRSDRLKVCSVDYGDDVAQVVTSAAEVQSGMKVIFAVSMLLAQTPLCSLHLLHACTHACLSSHAELGCSRRCSL